MSTISAEFYWIAVAVVSITSASRLTRLLTWDEFPPIKWARYKFADFTDRHDRLRGWQLLAFCGYCMSFWMMLAVVGSGWLSDFHVAWWLVNAILGGSYLAAILMTHDGDDGDDDAGGESSAESLEVF